MGKTVSFKFLICYILYRRHVWLTHMVVAFRTGHYSRHTWWHQDFNTGWESRSSTSFSRWDLKPTVDCCFGWQQSIFPLYRWPLFITETKSLNWRSTWFPVTEIQQGSRVPKLCLVKYSSSSFLVHLSIDPSFNLLLSFYSSTKNGMHFVIIVFVVGMNTGQVGSRCISSDLHVNISNI